LTPRDTIEVAIKSVRSLTTEGKKESTAAETQRKNAASPATSGHQRSRAESPNGRNAAREAKLLIMNTLQALAGRAPPKSLFRNILRISSLKSKIWREFFPNPMILKIE
jgi:hypothetical protein